MRGWEPAAHRFFITLLIIADAYRIHIAYHIGAYIAHASASASARVTQMQHAHDAAWWRLDLDLRCVKATCRTTTTRQYHAAERRFSSHRQSRGAPYSRTVSPANARPRREFGRARGLAPKSRRRHLSRQGDGRC
eukprot:scaffold2630_cov118-Isochrysis_galbana.AAC.9